MTPIKRNTTPHSELSGLLVLSRLLSSLWDGFSKRPSRVSILGNSECTINSVEAEETVLKEWFDNCVSEIQENFDCWSEVGTQVDPLHHWPGTTNPADIVTKGQGTIADLHPDGVWQTGPKVPQFSSERWPSSRHF